MSEATDKLKAEWEAAEAKAVELQNKKDAEIAAVQAKHRDKLIELVDAAATAQKAFLDEEVKESLRDRPDGQAVADSLGIDLD